jgi:hypothetical protein
MALLYKAQLVPSKLELVAAWAPKQRWFAGETDAAFASVASFRFDDPAGEVGVETLLVRAGGGPVLQVPLTYRNDEVVGAEHFLIGTLEHSVLGKRWVYDATGDPIYLGELARAALTGGSQVEEHYEIDGTEVRKDPTAIVRGSGSGVADIPSAQDDHVPAARNDLSSTLVETDHLTLLVARQPVAHPLDVDDRWQRLDGTWTNQAATATLALVSARG